MIQSDLPGEMKSRIVRGILTGSLLICVIFASCSKAKTELLFDTVIPEESIEVEESYTEQSRTEQTHTEQTHTEQTHTEQTNAKKTDVIEETQLIYIYVCGAVMRPGVVALPYGSRAEEAVNAAGGFSKEADETYINLAAQVSDGEKLLIPTMEEALEAAIEDHNKSLGLVNINQADIALLCTLSGIGESRAMDIIAYREENGNFKTIEEIMNVTGIKENTFKKIRDKITIE
ncbi:helix-hairpin-helix domain-containing protein [Lachnospiraceae bacterium OttesenSCG-928-D06]|nr:helix-hairpin-helix domain-containing protein [Lachnospiraceae bacterium OttesenSCG-928-D06]